MHQPREVKNYNGDDKDDNYDEFDININIIDEGAISSKKFSV